MIKKLQFVAVLLLASALSVFAQTPKWISTLDGQGNEIPLNITTSKDGNVYVMSKSFTKKATPSIDYYSFDMADGTSVLEKSFFGVPDTFEASGNCNIVINKIDAQTGRLLWNLHSNKGGFDGGGEMTATPDNGLLIFFKVRHTSRGAMYPETLLQLVDDDSVATSIQWKVENNFGYAYQGVLVKVSEAGKIEWTKHIPVAYRELSKKANDCFNAGEVQIDKDGNIYVVGRYADNINFGAKANLQNPRNVIGWDGDPQKTRGDLFIVKMDPKGEPIWNVVSSGDAIECENLDNAVLANGKLYVGGYIKGDDKSTINFGKVQLTPGDKKSILYACVNPENGDVEWAKVINSRADAKKTRPNCKPMCLTVDGNDLYLGGSFAADLVTEEDSVILSSGDKMLQAYVIKCNATDGTVQNSIFMSPSIGEVDAIDVVGDRVLAAGYVLSKASYLYNLDRDLSRESLKVQIVKESPTGVTVGGVVIGDMYVSATRARNASIFPGLDWQLKPNAQSSGVTWVCIFDAVPLADMLALNLYDAEEYKGNSDVEEQYVNYTRNFENTEWQALYLPFGLNVADLQADFDVARINNVHQYDTDNDGVIDDTQLEVIILADGVTEANVPYLIKAKTAGQKTLSAKNVLVKAAAPFEREMTSWNTSFKVYGTYKGIADMFATKYYALSNGVLAQATQSAPLNGYRWYLDVNDRDGNFVVPTQIKLLVLDENGNVTGVEEIEANASNSNVWPANVYSIQGKLVKANAYDLQGLPKGVYVVNGKKVIR